MKTLLNYEGLGFNKKECLKQAKLLKKVMFRTQDVKSGRGKKAIVTQEYVYNTEEDEEVRTKIINTIKHYEIKMETLSKKDNK